MKVIVYNSKCQYAMSRKQVERIKEILPKESFFPIREFHLTHSLEGAERFEYVHEGKKVHFYYPVEQKTPKIISDAVTELLLGLSRIKTDANWGYVLSERERDSHLEFIELWHSKCIAALV